MEVEIFFQDLVMCFVASAGDLKLKTIFIYLFVMIFVAILIEKRRDLAVYPFWSTKIKAKKFGFWFLVSPAMQ